MNVDAIVELCEEGIVKFENIKLIKSMNTLNIKELLIKLLRSTKRITYLTEDWMHLYKLGNFSPQDTRELLELVINPNRVETSFELFKIYYRQTDFTQAQDLLVRLLYLNIDFTTFSFCDFQLTEDNVRVLIKQLDKKSVNEYNFYKLLEYVEKQQFTLEIDKGVLDLLVHFHTSIKTDTSTKKDLICNLISKSSLKIHEQEFMELVCEFMNPVLRLIKDTFKIPTSSISIPSNLSNEQVTELIKTLVERLK